MAAQRTVRRRRDPDRKERILVAAAALGAARGFDAISMSDVGAEAGIVGSGVYRHFDSKTAILVAMADRVMDRLMTALGNEVVNFDALHKADPQQLAKFIHNEHPQTIALVLSHLNPTQAAALLGEATLAKDLLAIAALEEKGRLAECERELREIGLLIGTEALRAAATAAHGLVEVQHDARAAATILEDWRLFQDGTVGPYKVNRLGRDIRETTTLGPLTYERGVLHGVHWEQNRNGITFTYPGVHEQRDAISEHAFRDPTDERDVRLLGDANAYNAYVVEVNPTGGRRSWIYVDKRTGYTVRKEWVQRRRRYVSSYDDYHLVDGVPEPSRIRTVDSIGNEREQILVNRTFDTTPDPNDIEMPPARHVVEFPEKQTPVRLPVRFVNGLAVVRVIVGRTGYDFLLDSGAAGIVIDPSIVRTVAVPVTVELTGTYTRGATVVDLHRRSARTASSSPASRIFSALRKSWRASSYARRVLSVVRLST